MGFTLRVESDDPAVAAAADEAFGRFGTAPPGERTDFLFQFKTTGLSGALPSLPSFQDTGRVVRCSAGRVAEMRIDRTSGTAEGVFSAEAVETPSYLRCHFLETALLVLVGSRGLMGVHGAAIVRHRTAILLRGASGTGKSTLAYAAARSGRFQALAEDVVWIDHQAKLWRGLPWWHHLLPDAVRFFPELKDAGPPVQIRGKQKLAIDLDRFHVGAATAEARPGSVVFLRRANRSESRLEPLPHPIARGLWESGKAGTESDFPDYQRRVDELLRGAFLLELGTGLDDAIDLLQAVASPRC